MSRDIDDLIRRISRPPGRKSLIERYNGHVDDFSKYTEIVEKAQSGSKKAHAKTKRKAKPLLARGTIGCYVCEKF